MFQYGSSSFFFSLKEQNFESILNLQLSCVMSASINQQMASSGFWHACLKILSQSTRGDIRGLWNCTKQSKCTTKASKVLSSCWWLVVGCSGWLIFSSSWLIVWANGVQQQKSQSHSAVRVCQLLVTAFCETLSLVKCKHGKAIRRWCVSLSDTGLHKVSNDCHWLCSHLHRAMSTNDNKHNTHKKKKQKLNEHECCNIS